MNYYYVLPKELIAQEPVYPRNSSRLMVLSPKGIEHRHFKDLPRYLKKGDVLVVNNTKVLPVRLRGRKPTGGKVEVTLLKELSKGLWNCLVKGRVGGGSRVYFKNYEAEIYREEGERYFKIKFKDVEPWNLIKTCGETPLPPYIKRKVALEEYQTVYAEVPGSVAAPTAGLHFTRELLEELKRRGVRLAKVTLHIGPGTFLPVDASKVSEYKIDPEFYAISEETAETINSAERVIAVGTTTVKALESASENGIVKPGSGWSDLFIYPPYTFRSRIDGLITNFHLPGSTLLMLVSAYAGWDRIREAYEEAVEKRYRFYSFGDAMLILKCSS